MSAVPSHPSRPPGGASAPEVIAYRTKPPGILSELLRAACVICFGYDLFLSHRHANRQYALRLWPRLEERGLITCFDAKDFHLGQRLRLTMKRTVSDSSALLLLDTDEARNSGHVQHEVTTALAHPRPVIEIRQKGLGPNPWIGLGADDELLYAEEPRDAFDRGVPTEAVIEHIVSRHRAVRRRTWFLLTALLIGLVLAAFAAYASVEREFERRMAIVYAAIGQSTSTILEANRAFEDLDRSWVFGWFGRQFRLRDVQALQDVLAGLWLKPIEPTPLTTALDLADAEERTFTDAFSNSSDLAVAPDGAVMTIVNGRITRVQSSAVQCAPLPEPPLRIALSPSGGALAVLTARHIYLWHADRCHDVPEQIPLFTAVDQPARVVGLAFGNEGRTLLLALTDRVALFSCTTELTCQSGPMKMPREILANAGEKERICAAALSPTSAVWAARLGSCQGNDDTICLAVGPMECSARTAASGLSFDAPGKQLAVRTAGLSTWPARATHPDGQRDRAGEGLVGANLQRVALDPAGQTVAVVSRLKNATGIFDRTLLSLYTWPELTWLQALPLPVNGAETPTYMFFGATIAVRIGDRSLAFDVRSPRVGDPNPAERRTGG